MAVGSLVWRAQKPYGNVWSQDLQKKKKTITWNHLIQCWTFWKGGELLKYLGGVVRSKDCRIKKWRGNEFAVMLTTSLYYFVLLSENVTFEIKIVHIYPVFLIDVGVWNLVCDSEERLYTKFGNSAVHCIILLHLKVIGKWMKLHNK